MSAARLPTPIPGAILQLDGLSKRFGETIVLDGIDLTIARGEIVALVGPSGSGKTTLMRCVAGLDAIDGGAVLVEGLAGVRRTSSRRYGERVPIGVVFQRFNLFPHLTAIQNIVEAPVRVLGTPSLRARQEALWLLERMDLADRADHYPAELSGGQQQRVAIARALAMHPSVLLFDEPTSALDPEMVGEVARMIRELAGEGIAILVVTHEMALVRHVADRVIVLDGGHIVEQGAVSTVFAAPAHERTRRFLAAIGEA